MTRHTHTWTPLFAREGTTPQERFGLMCDHKYHLVVCECGRIGKDTGRGVSLYADDLDHVQAWRREAEAWRERHTQTNDLSQEDTVYPPL